MIEQNYLGEGDAVSRLLWPHWMLVLKLGLFESVDTMTRVSPG